MSNAKPINQKDSNSKKNLASPLFGNAYTLIEILVALTIFSLIFLVGFAGYREYSRRQLVNSVARQMKADIRFTQELAFSGKKPAVCGALSALDGYSFLVVPGGSYEIHAVCGAQTPLEKTVTLPVGISLSALSPNLTPSNSIIFKSLGQGTNIGAGATTQITLTQAETSYTQVVTVTAGGEIR